MVGTILIGAHGADLSPDVTQTSPAQIAPIAVPPIPAIRR
jgi:hypothetical protein